MCTFGTLPTTVSAVPFLLTLSVGGQKKQQKERKRERERETHMTENSFLRGIACAKRREEESLKMRKKEKGILDSVSHIVNRVQYVNAWRISLRTINCMFVPARMCVCFLARYGDGAEIIM